MTKGKFGFVFQISLLIALLGSAGCVKTTTTTTREPVAVAKADDLARMQGTWTGRDIVGRTDEAPSRLTVAGNSFEFHAGDPNEWYKCTFVLNEKTDPKQILVTVKECPDSMAKYIGAVSHGIYKFEGGKLTIGAREPGNPEGPASFTDAETRVIEFKK